MEQQTTLVIGSLMDMHNLGARVIRYALTEAGFNVINIGGRLTQEEFVQAAIETDANAILVSSSYGHAEFDAAGMREKCIEAGLGNILMYIGGNLTVAGQVQSLPEIEGRFKEMGFDRVYHGLVMPEQVISDLKADLKLRSVAAEGKEKG